MHLSSIQHCHQSYCKIVDQTNRQRQPHFNRSIYKKEELSLSITCRPMTLLSAAFIESCQSNGKWFICCPSSWERLTLNRLLCDSPLDFWTGETAASTEPKGIVCSFECNPSPSAFTHGQSLSHFFLLSCSSVILRLH